MVGYRWSCPSANRGTSPGSPPIPSVFGGFFAGYIRRARMAITPPGYCSGVVVTFLEPHLEHFMRLQLLAGFTSRSWQQSRQYTHNSLSASMRSASVTGEVNAPLST